MKGEKLIHMTFLKSSLKNESLAWKKLTLSVSFQKTNAGGFGLITKQVKFKLEA